MRRTCGPLACLAVATLAAVSPALAQSVEEIKAATPTWRVEWKEGFRFERSDGKFKLKIGGRVHNDWASFDADPALAARVGAFEGGGEFRRLRIAFEGLVEGRLELKSEIDFSTGESEVKDVYVGLTGLPGVGTVRVGHFKEPLSLDDLTSTNYPTFLELPLPVEAFSPSRSLGVQLGRSFPKTNWAAGVFKDADNFGRAVEDGATHLTGRLTRVAWGDPTTERYLHLGIAGSLRSADAPVRFRTRPEAHLAPRLLDSGNLALEEARILGLEAALVRGAWSAQAEWLMAELTGLPGGTARVGGWTASASWFPTGESRPYQSQGGVFGRVRPKASFGSGPGAWQLALRYSTLDLDDGPVRGGAGDAVTVGVNWYPYPNARWMVDVSRAEREGVGAVDTVQTRFQFDF